MMAAVDDTEQILETSIDDIHQSGQTFDCFGNTFSQIISHAYEILKIGPTTKIIYGSFDPVDIADESNISGLSDIDIYCSTPVSLCRYMIHNLIKVFPNSAFCIKSAIHPYTLRIQIWQRTIIDITYIPEHIVAMILDDCVPMSDSVPCYCYKAGPFLNAMEICKFLCRPGLSFNSDPNCIISQTSKFEKKRKELEEIIRNPPNLLYYTEPSTITGQGSLYTFEIMPKHGIYSGSVALVCIESLLGINGSTMEPSKSGNSMILTSSEPFQPHTLFNQVIIAKNNINYTRTFNDLLPKVIWDRVCRLIYNVDQAPPEFVYCTIETPAGIVMFMPPIFLLAELFCIQMMDIRDQLENGTSYLLYYNRILNLFKHQIGDYCTIIPPSIYCSAVKGDTILTQFFGSDKEFDIIKPECDIKKEDFWSLYDKKKILSHNSQWKNIYWSII